MSPAPQVESGMTDQLVETKVGCLTKKSLVGLALSLKDGHLSLQLGNLDKRISDLN